jgi:hypothetical protein
MDNMRGVATNLAIPGMPEWTGLLILVVGLLCAAAFLLMPFSVFGVKARLEAIEVQLDEIQAEIRSLAVQLSEPEMPARAPISEDWVEPPGSYGSNARALAERDRAPASYAAPVPPPAEWPEQRPARGRADPRLDWPRR